MGVCDMNLLKKGFFERWDGDDLMMGVSEDGGGVCLWKREFFMNKYMVEVF